MTTTGFLDPINSTKLISMDYFLNEMIELYRLNRFPKVLLLNGKKGIGKFTLVLHFINYIFTLNEKKPYNLKDKTINSESIFYNQLLNKTSQNVMLIKAEENKNIKIEDIRSLKSTLSRSSLSADPRFIIIDEVEFLNENSANALLKSLEEPSNNNFFILINNQQADLIKTISSRCLKNNIFLNLNETKKIINYLLTNNNIEDLIDFNSNLTPGLFLQFNEIYSELDINKNEKIEIKISKILNRYKKDKNKILISLVLYSIDQYFFELVHTNNRKIDFLLKLKNDINKLISDFINYNLNINSVLNSIEVKLNNV
jgi:DNA polymerase III delta prime subunit